MGSIIMDIGRMWPIFRKRLIAVLIIRIRIHNMSVILMIIKCCIVENALHSLLAKDFK